MQEPASELVSVVIPVYNAEKYLEETLASIFAQTYPHIEIIAVDDGSKDRSIQILEQYPDKVRIVRQPNKGAATARNRGVQEARGKWIAFLDSDDLWTPDKIQRQLDVCGHYAWSHTNSVFMGGVNDGRRDSDFTAKHQGQVLEQLICSNFIGTSTLMILRQAFLDVGGFDESLRSIQDWELWIRTARRYPIGYVDAPLMRYRVHAVSASRSTRNTLPNHLRVIDKVFALGGPAEALRHLKRSAKARSYTICSQIAEEEGDFAFALRCSLLACQQEPAIPGRWIRAAKTLIKYLLSLVGYKKHVSAGHS